LVELTGMPVMRISGIVRDRGAASLQALFEKAQLPPSTYPAFKQSRRCAKDLSMTRAARRGSSGE
jgi:hypothetical protein